MSRAVDAATALNVHRQQNTAPRGLTNMKLSYRKFDLPLRHVFTISRGSVSVQQTLIVQLEADGKYGYGEATTNTFYGATIENMSSTIESVRSVIEESTLEDPLALIDAITKRVP